MFISFTLVKRICFSFFILCQKIFGINFRKTGKFYTNIKGCTAFSSFRGIHMALCQKVMTTLRGQVTLKNVNTSNYGQGTVIKFERQAQLLQRNLLDAPRQVSVTSLLRALVTSISLCISSYEQATLIKVGQQVHFSILTVKLIGRQHLSKGLFIYIYGRKSEEEKNCEI